MALEGEPAPLGMQPQVAGTQERWFSQDRVEAWAEGSGEAGVGQAVSVASDHTQTWVGRG